MAQSQDVDQELYRQGQESRQQQIDLQQQKLNRDLDPRNSPTQGTNVQNVQTAAPGVLGFLGNTVGYDVYTPKHIGNDSLDKDREAVQQSIYTQQRRLPIAGAQAAQIGEGAQVSTAAQDQTRAQQMQLAQALSAQANGTGGPTAAQAQLQSGADRNLADALAMAQTQRGSPIAGLKAAMNQRAAITQNTANQSAQLRAQEQQLAQQQLGNVLAGTRGQDQNFAMGQAGFDQQTLMQNSAQQQQTNLNNQQSAVQQRAQQDAMIQQYMQMGMTIDQARQQSAIQQEQFTAGLLAQQRAAAAGIGIQNSAQGAQLAGAGLAAAGTIAAAAASDMHVKKNIEDGSKETRSFLEAISPKKYEYTEEKYGQGKFLGFLAQDMEKSKMGKEMVKEVGGVKHIDTWKALSAALASLADMHGRVKKLEK